MEKQITLKEILDPISVDLFFKEYWGKKHLVIRRNKFKDLFHWGHLTKYVNRYPHVPHLQILDHDDKGNRWCLDKRRKKQDTGPMYTKHCIHELWKKGIKTLYYMRTESVLRGDIAKQAMDPNCLSCDG